METTMLAIFPIFSNVELKETDQIICIAQAFKLLLRAYTENA